MAIVNFLCKELTGLNIPDDISNDILKHIKISEMRDIKQERLRINNFWKTYKQTQYDRDNLQRHLNVSEGYKKDYKKEVKLLEKIVEQQTEEINQLKLKNKDLKYGGGMFDDAEE
tara:strand:- start:217 stop:561 length:345 start_codon:yes stop_codon:yes gene_type:complete